MAGSNNSLLWRLNFQIINQDSCLSRSITRVNFPPSQYQLLLQHKLGVVYEGVGALRTPFSLPFFLGWLSFKPNIWSSHFTLQTLTFLQFYFLVPFYLQTLETHILQIPIPEVYVLRDVQINQFSKYLASDIEFHRQFQQQVSNFCKIFGFSVIGFWIPNCSFWVFFCVEFC